MPKGPLTSPRADKGTRRYGDEKDKFYTFRLNPNDADELRVIQALDGWLDKNRSDKKSLRDLIKILVNDQLPKPITREEQIVETLEQQIERLASSIDRLLTLKLERASDKPQQEEEAGVNMDYLKRIQQTLRGGKK